MRRLRPSDRWLCRARTGPRCSAPRGGGRVDGVVGDRDVMMLARTLRAVRAESRSSASTLGSSTITGWKRRSSAASDSTYLRYSSKVVAPMHCSSPRASSGLIIELRVERAFGGAGADERVQLVDEENDVARAALDFVENALDAAFEFAAILRAGNERSEREREHALVCAATRERCRRRCVGPSPSTIAVLPTPGSPTSTGLFLLRRARIETTRSISSSRPMTGSSLPARASSVRSREKFGQCRRAAGSRLPVVERRDARCGSRPMQHSREHASGDEARRGQRRAKEREARRSRCVVARSLAHSDCAPSNIGAGRRPQASQVVVHACIYSRPSGGFRLLGSAR